MLGLSDEELGRIRARPEAFPLRHLRPRYPWEPTDRGRRPTRRYEADRFR
jgi:hypothetical protein